MTKGNCNRSSPSKIIEPLKRILFAAQVARLPIKRGHEGHAVDVADEAAVIALFADIEARLGRVSVLVCAAGLLIMPGGERPPSLQKVSAALEKLK